MNQAELKRVVEAVLFVSDKPMAVKDIWNKLFKSPDMSNEDAAHQALAAAANEPDLGQGDDASNAEKMLSQADSQRILEMSIGVSLHDIQTVVDVIEEDYLERAVQLKQVASGYRFQVDTALSGWMARWKAEKPPKYSRAVLETLSIIAYKQPVTRAEIEEIRGVAVSSHIVKSLLEREWVRVVGHKEVPGRPALLATTKQFLDYFNMDSLDKLPTLTEVKEFSSQEPDIEELESQEVVAEKTSETSEQAEVVAAEDTVQSQVNSSIVS